MIIRILNIIRIVNNNNAQVMLKNIEFILVTSMLTIILVVSFS